MKVILIRPPFSIKRAFLSTQPPLNLMGIAAFLIQHGIDVKIWDYDSVRFKVSDISNQLLKEKPDLIGISSTTASIVYAHEIAKIIKDAFPYIKIVVGGCHASAVPERTLREFSAFDSAVFGEGEETLREICSRIEEGRGVEGVKGVAHKIGSRIFVEQSRPLINNLDELPYPKRDLLDMESYRGQYHRGFYLGELKIAPIITSRGCPGQCIFCASKVVFGSRVRTRSIKNVFDEMKEWIAEHRINHFTILDENLTANRNRLKELCGAFERLHVTWNCWMRADLVDEDLLRLMAESGCKGIQFGVESGSSRLLKLMKKNVSLKQMENAFRCAQKFKIITDATVILGGHPSETREEIEETFKYIKRLNPKVFSAAVMIPYPGTEINTILKEKGYLREEDWNKFVLFGSKPPEYATDHFTSLELQKIQYWMLLRFYFRVNYLLNKIRDIRNFADLKYWFKSGIDFIKSILLLLLKL